MAGWLTPLDIPIQIDRDEARRRALEELSKAKYGGTPEWLQSAAERATRLLERLLDLYTRWRSGPGAAGGGSPGFWIAVALLLTALILVIWRVGLPKWRKRVRQESLDLDPSRPASDYRGLSQQAAGAGDWTAAVRDRFRAVVRELEVRTILDVRPARTAWEAAYAASRALPTCAEALQSGAAVFNLVVYGDGVADERAYADLVALDEAVTAAADSTDLTLEVEPVGR
ncbi:MAG TPA: DUF4129 domain-containing protein [Propionibacteriaceae bacterium]